MGNRQAREFMLRQQEAADWERVRTEDRPATCDVSAPGIGARRLQLIVCPSFSKWHAWEVRSRQTDWWLFRSKIITPWPDVRLVGYDPLPIDSEVLSSFYSRIVGLTLSIAPALSNRSGLDGTVTQLAVFGDLFSEWRFQWWSQPPEQWRSLVNIASEMLTVFSEAEHRTRL